MFRIVVPAKLILTCCAAGKFVAYHLESCSDQLMETSREAGRALLQLLFLLLQSLRMSESAVWRASAQYQADRLGTGADFTIERLLFSQSITEFMGTNSKHACHLLGPFWQESKLGASVQVPAHEKCHS